MRIQEAPSKYRELMSRRPTRIAVHGGIRPAFHRLLNGTETLQDRAAIAKNAYDSHWGTEAPDEERSQVNDPMRDMDPVQYHAMLATRYRGAMKRVFDLQARVAQTEGGSVTIAWYDTEAERQETIIDQAFVDNLIQMAVRMRESLYDGGYQSVVNKIHNDLKIEQNGYMFTKTETLEGGDNSWHVNEDQ